MAVRQVGPLLVATDRSDASLPAVRAAGILDSATNRGVAVLAVVEPLPLIVPEPTSLLRPLVISPELTELVRTQTARQIEMTGGKQQSWSIEIEEGRPADEIASSARRHLASLVILGLSHHSLFDRVIDGDTAIEVLRESDTPLLLASKDFTALPKVALVGVDFSPESMEAARASIPLLSANCVIHLAHVRPSVTIFDASGLWEDEYEKVAVSQLDTFKATLAAPSTMRVETTILLGSPATALTEYANRIGADLIVSGTHGIGLMRRIFIGSVASGLLRKSERSLLLVPKPTHQQKKED
jgi:nucleotide-binding universal stress UspA family protein